MKIQEARDRSSASGKKWEDYKYIICPDGEKIDMEQVLDDQNRARAALVHLEPTFGGFIGRLRPVYTFQIPTQAVDGVNLFINPQFTAHLDLTGKVAVMAHEIMHCLLNHIRRGRGHDPERSNIAADYECNITIAEMGLLSSSVDKGIAIWKSLHGYIDKKYAGWGYEKIYDDIGSQSSSQNMSNQSQSGQADKNSGQRQQGGQSGNQSGSQGQGDGEGDGDGQSGSQGQSGKGGKGGKGGKDKSNQSGQGAGQGQQPGSQGSGGDGVGDPAGEGSRDAKGGGGDTGVVRPEDCIGPAAGQLSKTPGAAGGMIDRATGDKIAEAEGYDKQGGSDSAVESEWKDAAIKASNKMKGNGPGNLKSKIEALYMTSTNWKKELRNVVGHAISPDEKRQAYANKNVLTAQNRIARTDKDRYDNLDYMMAWIDSSGSMSDQQLRQCLGEVYAVALAKKPITLVVVQCDTKIQEIKEYHNLRDLQRELKNATVKGRGGTDLKPCWELLQKDPKYSRRAAELVMVFTDGYLDQYKRDPRKIRTLCWVVLDNPGFRVQYKDAQTKLVCINTEDIK